VTELLDIDLDFAVVGTAGAVPRPPQRTCPRAAAILTDLISLPAAHRWLMDEHVHALTVWWQLGVRNARCWHVDAHHDLYGSTDVSAWRMPCVKSSLAPAPRSTSATYLLRAWRVGVVREVVWVIPDWLPMEAAQDDLRREMGSDTSFVRIVRGSNTMVPAPAITTIAWSTRWLSPHLHDEVAKDLPREALAALVGGTPLVAWPPYTTLSGVGPPDGDTRP